ncbi:MAG: hypothetical protein VZR09_11710 [Candidatus Gastranaerophilaceae bacterium]|nr:hypothetical protein [Candidatus Gastranaerophilaceae bacterium]
MDVKSFVEHVFQEKSRSLGLRISDYQKKQILHTFDLDAVQNYIDNDIRKHQANALTTFERHQVVREVEAAHRMRLRKITEQWTVYYARLSRRKVILLEEDFKAITESMKQQFLFCDAYPCRRK